ETETEFMDVSGVGEAKKEKYAGRFLEIITSHQQHTFSKLPTQKQTFLLYKEGIPIEEIAKTRGLQTETIYGHLLKAHEDGETVPLEKFISDEEVKAVAKAARDLNNPEGLKPYFDYFETKVPYWKIRMGLYLTKLKVSSI